MHAQLLLCKDHIDPSCTAIHGEVLQRHQVSFRDLHYFHVVWERIVLKRHFGILRETDTP